MANINSIIAADFSQLEFYNPNQYSIVYSDSTQTVFDIAGVFRLVLTGRITQDAQGFFNGDLTGYYLTDTNYPQNFQQSTTFLAIDNFSTNIFSLINLIATQGPSAPLGVIFSGDDLFTLSDGNDIAVGFTGNDVLFGNAGNDSLVGGRGAGDLLATNDRLVGGLGDDTLIGSGGNNTLQGGQGRDYIDGGEGNNIIYGAFGSDTIVSGSGNDTIYGGNFNDVIQVDGGNNLLYGGLGGLDPLDGVDSITGGTGNDTIYGQGGNDTIRATGGENDIYAGADNDLVFGGTGYDIIFGGAGNDTIYASSGGTDIYGGAGNDDLYSNAANQNYFNFSTGSGTDRIFQFQQNDIIWVERPLVEILIEAGITDFASFSERFSTQSYGTFIDLGLGNGIELHGFSIERLTLDNFVFE